MTKLLGPLSHQTIDPKIASLLSKCDQLIGESEREQHAILFLREIRTLMDRREKQMIGTLFAMEWIYDLAIRWRTEHITGKRFVPEL